MSDLFQMYRELLSHYGGRIMSFQRTDGSWTSSAVFRSDSTSTVNNFNVLSAFFPLLSDNDYAATLTNASEFLLNALEDGDLEDREIALFFRGLCLIYAFTGERRYLDIIDHLSDWVFPEDIHAERPDIMVKKVIYLASVYRYLPHGYKGRARLYFERIADKLVSRSEHIDSKLESASLSLALDMLGLLMNKRRLCDRALSVISEWFEDDFDSVYLENILVSRYLFFDKAPGDEIARIKRFLKRKTLYTIRSEETSNILLVSDLALTKWDEVFTQPESLKYVPKLDQLLREKYVQTVNPDGGWGDEYIYRATATAGIALYNIYLATGVEAFRDAALNAGEFLRNTLWDLHESVYYSMDKISELFFLIYQDLGDDGYAALLENIHSRIRRSIRDLDETDRENLLWYSAMYCIVTYYLYRMIEDEKLKTGLKDVVRYLTLLLDPDLYDTTYYPWLQATILAQEIAEEDDSSLFGLFKPYLARMTIDEDTTIRDEIEFQRFLYTYDCRLTSSLVRTARRRAHLYLRKDIILNIVNIITVAKVYRLLEAEHGHANHGVEGESEREVRAEKGPAED